MKRWVVVAGALSVVLSGCQGKREFGPPQGNVYRIPIPAKFTSLDPHVTSDVYSSQAQALAYESLLQFDFNDVTKVVPNLAAELPKVTNNYKTWVFKLRPGTKFHDDPCFKATGGKGRELVASDYEYFFERVADKKLGSPVFSGFTGVIKGIDDFRAGKAPKISGVKVLDRYTIQIDLDKPTPRFVFNFVNTHTAPVPKECVEYYGEKINEHAIGTGPFQIKNFSSTRASAEKSPTFREQLYPGPGELNGKRLPLVDKVELEVVTEDQPRWLRFMAGEFEQITVPKDNLQSAVSATGELTGELKERKVAFFREVQNDVVVHVFNLRDPVWGKNKDLRHAFSLAMDAPEFIKTMYVGFGIPAETLLAPGNYGYFPDFRSKWSNRNVERAKELLAKAGYPGGKGLPPVVIPLSPGAYFRQSGEFVTRLMAEVGIPVKIEQMPWPEITKRLKEGNFTVVQMGWAGDVPDAESALPMFHSRSLPPNGQNYPHFKHSEYDKLIEEIEVLPNGATRLAKIRRALEILDDELPVRALLHRRAKQLYQPWVKNPTFADEMFVIPMLRYRAIQPAEAKK